MTPGKEGMFYMNLIEEIKRNTYAFIDAAGSIRGGVPIEPDNIDIELVALIRDIGNAQDLQNNGIDRIAWCNYTEDENEREEYLESARTLSRLIDIPFFSGTYVKRFEDVKKAFYTGADAVIIRSEDVRDNISILRESIDRFGPKSIYIFDHDIALSSDGSKAMIRANDNTKPAEECIEEICGILGNIGDKEEKICIDPDTIYVCAEYAENSIMSVKHDLAKAGLKVNTFAGKVEFKELKTNSDGLVPCIVQDYKNGEVLMMAYMNGEAFDRTVKTGIMTYFSRSRRSLWVKGETSGHFQYVRELKADCDNDTLLAKVVQIGAACHTGNRSCFFNEVLKHEYVNKDISAVLRELYGVVCDRKINPKEGSYTNYLFNKGIDKILKKCGEEATEMVIAAKNPSHEELKYEIADLIYHMTVLMVECGVSWEEVATELANR